MCSFLASFTAFCSTVPLSVYPVLRLLIWRIIKRACTDIQKWLDNSMLEEHKMQLYHFQREWLELLDELLARFVLPVKRLSTFQIVFPGKMGETLPPGKNNLSLEGYRPSRTRLLADGPLGVHGFVLCGLLAFRPCYPSNADWIAC